MSFLYVWCFLCSLISMMTLRSRLDTWIKSSDQRRLLDIVVLVAMASIFRLLARPLHRTGFGYDEQWFVWGGWAITRGQAPYLDFIDVKPPVGFLVNAAGVALFGLNALAYRYVMAILAFFALALLYLAMRSRGHELLLAMCVTSLVLFLILDQRFHDNSLDDMESIGFAFFLSGISILLMAGKSAWLNATGGAMLAAAVLTKEPFVLSAIPAFASCIFLRAQRPRTELVRAACCGAVGGIAFGLAIAIYLALIGGLGGYLDVVTFYRRFADEYCVVLGIFHRSTFIGEFTQSLVSLRRGFLNWQTLGSLSPFLALGLFAAVVLRRTGALFAVLTVLGALYSITLGHCFWIHYVTMAFAPVALLSVAGADLTAERIMKTRYAWPARVVLISLMVFTLGPRVWSETGKRYRRPDPPFEPQLVEFIRKTTSATDTIFTAGEPGIYAFADRQSALANGTYTDELLDFLPGNTDEEKVAPAFAELMKKKPKIVLFETTLGEERKRRYFKALFLPYVQSMGYREVRRGVFVLP
jgi:hypothetical protein